MLLNVTHSLRLDWQVILTGARPATLQVRSREREEVLLLMECVIVKLGNEEIIVIFRLNIIISFEKNWKGFRNDLINVNIFSEEII